MQTNNKWADSEYCRTYTGRMFHPSHPEDLEIDIIDIANALGKITRYNGDLETFYSVAQHSCLVEQIVSEIYWRGYSRNAPLNLRLHALLHDATEAYLPDMPSPIKHILPDFIALENKIHDRIVEHFNLSYDEYQLIKEVDRNIRLDEIHCMTTWPEGEAPGKYGLIINAWDWRLSIENFLERYHEIINQSSVSKNSKVG